MLPSLAALSRRKFSSLRWNSADTTVFRDLRLIPNVFDPTEQKTLLAACLHKLDAMDGPSVRRKRRKFSSSSPPLSEASVTDVFCPDDYYAFELGHFDGVIRRYREMHVSHWNETATEPALVPLLQRLNSLCPTPHTQTHLLHLASDGEILPHVDNLQASGNWILGISLGAPRTMRLENVNNPSDHFQTLLPSGSVYLQSREVRYEYRHSILLEPEASVGQRLSIMIRDVLPTQ